MHRHRMERVSQQLVDSATPASATHSSTHCSVSPSFATLPSSSSATTITATSGRRVVVATSNMSTLKSSLFRSSVSFCGKANDAR